MNDVKLNSSLVPPEIKLDKKDLIPYIISEYPIYTTPTSDHFNSCYYNTDNLTYISKEVTKLLKGVHPDGKNIIVSDKNIISVMESIYENNPRTSTNIMIKMVIAFIVNYIKNEFGTIEQNNNLDIEVIKYDGSYGIRKVPPITTNKHRPTPFLFNMHY